MEPLTARNLQLEGEVTSLKKDYAEAIDDNVVICSKGSQLEAQSKTKVETEAEQQLQADFEDLVHENTMLNKKLKSQSENINQLDYSKTQLKEEFQSKIKVETDTIQQLQADLKNLNVHNDMCHFTIKQARMFNKLRQYYYFLLFKKKVLIT